LFDSSSFREGLCTVQDPSAGLASLLLAPRQGESVLDLCAAPGGKTTHLAYLMGDAGHIRAVDLHEKRLGLVRNAADRLGLSSIECVPGDVSSYGAGTEELFDRVLLDAPCSGTAVFSKRPDMKWRLSADDIRRLAKLQAALLETASRLVKPGGTLVYSTCTLEREENGDMVDSFLARHPEYTVGRDERFVGWEYGRGYLVLPHRMGGAGAYAAKLKRSSYDE
jgi:16S rRNA (cytosine967-C5)-methyltransferase